MWITLQTSIEVPDDRDEWEAKKLAKMKFENELISIISVRNYDKLNTFLRGFSISMPPPKPTNYAQEAEDDAKELITENYIDEIIERLIDDGEASDDYNNDYDNGDGIFHEQITDRYYNSTEAVELLDQLSAFEEEDRGLWEGITDVNDILNIKAAYTYGNAVAHEFRELIEKINDDIYVEDIKIEIAKELAIKLESTTPEIETDNTWDEDILEYIQEHHEDEFNDTLKERLKQEIKEIC